MLHFRCTNFHRQKISIARSDVKHAFESQFRKQRAFGVERNFSNIFEKCLEKAKQAEQLLPVNSSWIHTKIPFSVLFSQVKLREIESRAVERVEILKGTKITFLCLFYLTMEWGWRSSLYKERSRFRRTETFQIDLTATRVPHLNSQQIFIVLPVFVCLKTKVYVLKAARDEHFDLYGSFLLSFWWIGK